jgi:prepilin-type N-terminal cleavage/methylation domain-containing protein
MKKSISGFTIIELLVVIVIVALLAIVSFVSFNGATDRARNAQTINAAAQWAKALKQYQTRNGAYPAVDSCLGDNYKWGINASATQGTEVGQCRQDNAGFGVRSETAFYTAMAPYITSNPTPGMITASNSATSWFRGLYYYRDTGNAARLDLTLSKSAGTCPSDVGGYKRNGTGSTLSNGNLLCQYNIGTTIGYD